MRYSGKKKGVKHARISHLFDPPPLIEGEDPAVYAELLDRISTMVNPCDPLEEIWVRDVVDLQWEVSRYLRLNATLMRIKKWEGFSELDDLRDEVGRYFPELDKEAFDQLLDDWLNQNTTKKVHNTFASVGLTMHAVMAMTLFTNIDVIARIDGMIAMAEARRNAALRELERHRATLGRALRHAVEQVEDARSEMIETKPVEKKSAA
jgi:hypothetical protein